MAETAAKRQREETQNFLQDNEDPKRQKFYNQILSLLEEEEDHEPNQDFSSILTALQRELDDPFPEPGSTSAPERENPTRKVEEENAETERFMRHLLEASDDELGIPNRVDDGDGEGINGVDETSFCDGLWDLEDEAAKNNALLQSELFM